MSINYTTYVAQITDLLVTSTADTNFITILPGMIDYAEQRMYRELDLLATRVTDSSGSLTAQSNTFTLPTSIGTFLVVEDVGVITPSGATYATGSYIQLTPTSKQFINNAYPSPLQYNAVPEYFAMLNNTQIIIGPAPDQNYPIVVIGTQRPTPLSSGNPTTILTTMLPDVFIAASMVYGAGWQRDFGAQTDDPAKSASWENQYEKLMQSALVEEFRKKYQSEAWQSELPSPTATPKRA